MFVYIILHAFFAVVTFRTKGAAEGALRSLNGPLVRNNEKSIKSDELSCSTTHLLSKYGTKQLILQHFTKHSFCDFFEYCGKIIFCEMLKNKGVFTIFYEKWRCTKSKLTSFYFSQNKSSFCVFWVNNKQPISGSNSLRQPRGHQLKVSIFLKNRKVMKK